MFLSNLGCSLCQFCFCRYFLRGPAEIRCLATGTWSGVNATCQPVHCGTAPELDNAIHDNGKRKIDAENCSYF